MKYSINAVILCFILLFSSYISTSTTEARSIRLTSEYFRNPNFQIYEIPFDEFAQEENNDEFLSDNMPRKQFSKRYSRIGGTIVMG